MLFPKWDPYNRGGWISAVNPVLYEYGETYEAIKSRAMEYLPEDLTAEYPFSNWTQNYTYREVGDKPAGVNYVGFVAKMAGIDAVDVSLKYYRKNGVCHLEMHKFIPVPEGASKSDIEKLLTELELPESYPGLRFDRWEVSSVVFQDKIATNKGYSVEAIYENCMINYLIRDRDSDTIYPFCQLAEKGETVAAMTSFEGFGEVTWEKQPEATFVVNQHMSFSGTASLTKPSNPPSSGDSDKPAQLACRPLQSI